MSIGSLFPPMVRAALAVVLIALSGCARLPQTAAVAIPPIPAGEARVWVYRADEPYAGRGLPAVAANGRQIGFAEMGGAFYRDLPPGRYRITVETVGVDVNQSAALDLGPGQESYIKIVSLPSWVEYGDIMAYQRPTFYAWEIPDEAAREEIAHLSFNGGG